MAKSTLTKDDTIIDSLRSQNDDQYKRIGRLERDSTLFQERLGYQEDGKPTGNGIRGRLVSLEDMQRTLDKRAKRIEFVVYLTVSIILIEIGLAIPFLKSLLGI